MTPRFRAEVLALRHQLGALERQVGRPRWQPTDRLLLAAISRVLPRPAWRSLLPSPETLLRWHRELVRRKWAAYRRRPRGQRPVVRSELHDLIVMLAGQNPRWGYRRIQGELRKLGHRCSHWTVRKVLRRHDLPPAPRRGQRSWREFVHQHADQMLACDFFAVDTVWLQAVAKGVATVWKRDDEISPRQQVAVVLYGPKFVENRDLARRFMLAYIKGARYYNDAFDKKDAAKRKDVVSILLRNTAVKDADLYTKMVMPGIDPNGRVNLDSLADQQDYFLAKGSQKTRLDLKQVVDMQYAEWAVQKLGPYK